MTNETWQDPDKGPSENELAFDYVKADGFRTVWADGAIGGITPKGLIHFALYSERPAIPRRQVYPLEKVDERKSKLGNEVLPKRISRNSVVREMAVDVFMSAEEATNFANWLLRQIAELGRTKD